MKKTYFSFLFILFGLTTQAQSTVEVVNLQTIKGAPFDVINQLATDDVDLLSLNFEGLTDNQKTELLQLFYMKYKNLSTELSNQQLEDLTISIKDRSKIILGDQLYLEVSQNQPIFYRITGTTYLAQ